MGAVVPVRVLLIYALLVNTVFSIRDRDGVKTKSFHIDPQISEALHARPVEMHHQYSQVASNRPSIEYSNQYNQASDAAVTYQRSDVGYQDNQGNAERQGRYSYGFDVENAVTSYHSDCPPGATGQFPYLYDCRRFLNCWKGRGYIQTCAPGTVFNPDSLECDSPKKVVCLGLGSKVDTTLTSARLQQQPSIEPPRTYVTTATTARSEVRCTPGLSGLEPHPYDCSKFLNCDHGRTHIQSCGPGTLFNPLYSVCDHPHKVDCGGKSTGEDLSASRTTSEGDSPTSGTVTHYVLNRPSGHSNVQVTDHRVYQNRTDNRYEPSQNYRNDRNYPQGTYNSEIYNQQTTQHQGYPHPHPPHGHPVYGPPQPHYNRPPIPPPSGSYINPQQQQNPSYPSNPSQDNASGYGHGHYNGHSHGNWHNHGHNHHHHYHGQQQGQGQQINSSATVYIPGELPSTWTSVSYRRNWTKPTTSYGNGVVTPGVSVFHGSEGEDTQRPLNPGLNSQSWSEIQRTINVAPTNPPTYSERPQEPPQPAWTQTASHNWPSSSEFINLQKALVEEISPGNYSDINPDIKPGDSTTTTIYYATPVEDSDEEELFENIAGGDVPETFVGEKMRKNPAIPFRPSTDTDARQNYPSDDLNPTYNAPPASYDYGRDSVPSGSSVHVTTTNFSQVFDESNLYGGLLPPLSTPSDNVPHAPTSNPSIPSQSSPEISVRTGFTKTGIVPAASQNPSNESQVFVVYPVVPDSVPVYTPPARIPPAYNPQYSSVSHSRNWTTTSVNNEQPHTFTFNRTNPWRPSVNNRNIQNPMNVTVITTTYTSPPIPSDNSNPIVYTRETTWSDLPGTTNLNPNNPHTPYINSRSLTTEESARPQLSVKTVNPPPYNSEYYNHNNNPPINSENNEDMSKLPISEAIKALLRPYLNRSGTVTNEDIAHADSFIMKLATPPPPTAAPAPEENIEKDAEFIFTGEQVNLSQGSWRHSHNHTGPYHHPNHNHSHSHPHGHGHRPGNQNNHNVEFHRNHPHLPNPFKDAEPLSTPPTVRTPSTYPTTTNTVQAPTLPPDTNWLSEPDLRIDERFGGVEATTPTYYPTSRRPPQDGRSQANPNPNPNPSVDVRSGGTEFTLETFDCRNGIWVKDFEVCDGVNNCGNRMDEAQCDHLGYQVRLSNPNGETHSGRVEVRILGKWGYVCDDKFGMRDADVLCRELGFPLGASEVRGNSFYAPNPDMTAHHDALFVMDEVDCKGNETSLRECDFKGWGVNDCTSDEIVGVVCKVPVMKCPYDYWLCSSSKDCIPTAFVCDNVPDCGDGSDESPAICNSKIEYRLANGDGRLQGRVEVKYRGTWGTVCDDDFGDVEAQVLCHSLGFYGKAQVAKNAFGPGSGPIWLDQVSCLGNETSVDKCVHWNWGEHNCNHTEDISVKCSIGDVRPTEVTTLQRRPPNTEHTASSEEFDFYTYNVERSSKFLKNHKVCGTVNQNATDEFDNVEEQMQRVVKGNKAKRGQHPWQATIRTRGRAGKSSHWCGAVLISEKHLLTAAHCLVGYAKGAYFIRMGDHYANIAEASEVDVFIENWYIHEDFRKGSHMNNDIAVIVLKHPVRFNDYVQPICLPSKNSSYNEGKMCVISGWGSIQSGISTPSNNLRAAKIPIISNNVCKQPHVYGNSITEGMFCAGYLDESVDACDGDSGGPLVCTDNDVATLFGIISWGQHCGFANKPGVYVKIAHFADWINEKISVRSR